MLRVCVHFGFLSFLSGAPFIFLCFFFILVSCTFFLSFLPPAFSLKEKQTEVGEPPTFDPGSLKKSLVPFPGPTFQSIDSEQPESFGSWTLWEPQLPYMVVVGKHSTFLLVVVEWDIPT